jgi:hypothetical protein
MFNIHRGEKQHNQAYERTRFTLCSPANYLLKDIILWKTASVV